MDRTYRFALVCALLPLVVGVSIFVLWVLTRWDALMMAGILTLYGGVALFLVGLLALARYCGRSPRRNWLHALSCLGLLLLNFPVAYGIVGGAIAIETRYTVVVRNASERPLRHVRVVGGGVDEHLGTIPPGRSVDGSFRVQHDGELKLEAVYDNTWALIETIDGYVTNGMGGHAEVTFHRDGTVSVETRD